MPSKSVPLAPIHPLNVTETQTELGKGKDEKKQFHYQTIRQFLQEHPCFSEGGIRAWIFNEHTNGFHLCVRRIGRRVYLRPDLVFQWIESQKD